MAKIQAPKKRDFMIVYALGRATTPYEVAQQYHKLYYGQNLTPKDVSLYGPFYNVKKDLLDDKLLINVGKKEREKFVKTDMAKYLELIFQHFNNPELTEYIMQKLTPAFEQLAPQIVNICLKADPHILSLEDDVAFPFTAYFLLGILASTTLEGEPVARKYLQQAIQKAGTNNVNMPSSLDALPAVIKYFQKLDPKAKEKLAIKKYFSSSEWFQLILTVLALSPKRLARKTIGIFVKILEENKKSNV